MNDAVRRLFPALEKYVYLNSAAVSPLPAPSVDAVVAQLRDVSQHGSQHYMSWVAAKERCRLLLAQMLGVAGESIAFMRNTSDGFAAVAAGIDWRPGDNIVSFADEFPANYYAWRRVRDEFGVDLRLCPERDGRINTDELITMIDARTRLVALSAVQYASGFKIDLERVGAAAHRSGALFAVDVIQGLGAFGFDLPAQNVDIAAGASHKWLCAPEGCGFLYLSPKALETVRPVFVGWISVETPWDFADREQPFKENTLAWETGTGCSALFYGLEESLKLLGGIGLDKIEKYLAMLSDELCERLRGSDYDIVSSRAAGERSQIVCIKHRGGKSPNEIAEHLQSRAVIVSPRGERLRIAPHFYNNSADIAALVECLP